MSLTKESKKKLSWNPNAEEPFNRLKKAFTTAPILKQLIVEVDASDIGVGAILSHGVKPMHPIAFFSNKINPC